MSLSTPVLPNFLKIVLFTAAASMSVSALAGHHEKGEEVIGDLKEMSETDLKMESTQDELKAMLADDEAAEAAEAQANTELDVSDMVKEAQDIAVPEAE